MKARLSRIEKYLKKSATFSSNIIFGLDRDGDYVSAKIGSVTIERKIDQSEEAFCEAVLAIAKQ